MFSEKHHISLPPRKKKEINRELRDKESFKILTFPPV
jgi:hypothetical protein